VAVVFTLLVVVNVFFLVSGEKGKTATVAGLLTLLPLTFLLLTGLYLFVLPYVMKRRGQGREGG